MRHLPYVLLALYALLTAARLPAWQSDGSVWAAAAHSDPDDPWALNNAAHYRHDKNTVPLLLKLTHLRIPDWLPQPERQPYIIGYMSLADTLRASGFGPDSSLVAARAVEIAPALFLR